MTAVAADYGYRDGSGIHRAVDRRKDRAKEDPALADKTSSVKSCPRRFSFRSERQPHLYRERTIFDGRCDRSAEGLDNSATERQSKAAMLRSLGSGGVVLPEPLEYVLHFIWWKVAAGVVHLEDGFL